MGLLFLVLVALNDVVQDVLVTLNQSLRVLCSVLQLLVPVSLDPLKQRVEHSLLLLPQFLFFLLDL